MRVFSYAVLAVGLLVSVAFAEPPEKVMNLRFVMDQGQLKCAPPLKDIVGSFGAKKQWKKKDDNHWLLTLNGRDEMTGQRGTMVIALVVASDDKIGKFVYADKATMNDSYMSLGQTVAFFSSIIGSTSSYQACKSIEAAEQKRERQEELEKAEAEQKRLIEERKKHEAIEKQRHYEEEQASIAKEKEELELFKQKVDEAQIKADQRILGEYRQKTAARGKGSGEKQIIISKSGDNFALKIETSFNGQTVCKITTDLPKVETSYRKDGLNIDDYEYELLFEDAENDCFIKVDARPQASRENSVKMSYKGSCGTYCNRSTILDRVPDKILFPTGDHSSFEETAFKEKETAQKSDADKNRWK